MSTAYADQSIRLLSYPELTQQYANSFAELIRASNSLGLNDNEPPRRQSPPSTTGMLPLLPQPRKDKAHQRRPATASAPSRAAPPPPPPAYEPTEISEPSFTRSPAELDALFLRLSSRPPTRAAPEAPPPSHTITPAQERALAARLSVYQRPRPVPPPPHPRADMRLPRDQLIMMTDRMHYEGGVRKYVARHRKERGEVIEQARADLRR